jgi:hypothetical protein
LTLSLAALLLAPTTGCTESKAQQSSATASKSPLTIKDLEVQLTRHCREAWPDEEFAAIQILNFTNANQSGAVVTNVRVDWTFKPGDSHRQFTEAGIRMYRVADNFLVGTLEITDKPRVNMLLNFE